MIIKKITIYGFKLYKEETTLELDPRYNVIIGRNGVGKSTILCSIQFIIDEKYQCSDTKNSTLLHKALTGPLVKSAYIEIIFDNSAKHFPFNKNDIILRRKIDNKKDTYHINNKLSSHSEVSCLLQYVGFSRWPLYHLESGKLIKIVNSAKYRLKLVEQIAGVDGEVTKYVGNVLLNIDKKYEENSTHLCAIKERLKQFGCEYETLTNYKSNNETKLCLEYCILIGELKGCEKNIGQSENQLNNLNRKGIELRKNFSERTKQVEFLQDSEIRVKVNEEKIKMINMRLQLLVNEKSELNYLIEDLTSKIQTNKNKNLEIELKELNNKIENKRSELEIKKNQNRILIEKNKELERKKENRIELVAKEGRCKQFISKEERDAWIRRILHLLAEDIEICKEDEKQLRYDVYKLSASLHSLETLVNNDESELQELDAKIHQYDKEYNQYKLSYDSFQNSRRECWKNENILNETLTLLKGKLNKIDQSAKKAIGLHVLEGKDSVEQILKILRQQGEQYTDVLRKFYGQLIDNIEYPADIESCVEIAGGRKLFSYIVEHDGIGSFILDKLNDYDLPGEVTFIALNQLNVRVVNYPVSEDVTPIISKLTCFDRVRKAITYVFGRTLICRNFNICVAVSRTHRLHCVTIDGDRVTSSGILGGGYKRMDNKIKINAELNNIKKEIEITEQKLTDVREELSKIESSANAAWSDMERTRTILYELKDKFEMLSTKCKFDKKELFRTVKHYKNRAHFLTQCTEYLEEIQLRNRKFQLELHEDFSANLSISEQTELNTLNDAIMESETITPVSVLLEDIQKLKNTLTNFYRKKEELMDMIENVSLNENVQRLKINEEKLMKCNEQYEELNEQRNIIRNTIQERMKDKQKLFTELAELKNIENKLRVIDERLLEVSAKLTRYRQNLTEYNLKNSQFQRVPSEEMRNKYASCEISELYRKLELINKELKGYADINLEELEQLKIFKEKYERFVERNSKFNDLLLEAKFLQTSLEQEKHKFLQMTFELISKEFSEMFSSIVPGGYAELSQRNMTIGASFTSGGHTQNIIQLSGTQRMLIALIFAFSLHKSACIPFYLLDEIDRAFDTEHKAVIGNLIKEISENSQIITATFCSDILYESGQIFKVKGGHTMSYINRITMEEARNFIRDFGTYE